MKNSRHNVLLPLIFLTLANVIAQEKKAVKDYGKFYVKPYAGFIGVQNMTSQLQNNNQNTTISIENGFGFTTGIAFGYNFAKKLTAEMGWEYKSNDITVINNGVKTSGDYASNFIFLNGIYTINTVSRIKPYVGLGASLIQEIDLDFGQGEDTSFSTSGNIGFQGIAGLDFNFSKRWILNWEAKYVTFSEFNMKNEGNNDRLNNLKYNPFIFNIGIKYRF